MPLVEFIDVSKDWAGDPVFEAVSFSIEPGQKIGLVGRNGSGKTSLLRIVAGLDDDYRGIVKREPGIEIALVPQRFEPPQGLSCVEVLLGPSLALKERLFDMEKSFAEGAPCDLGAYGEIAARYEALGGDLAEEGARRLLARAGLGEAADTPAAALSGGEKNVLALAVALARRPGLLLLDEPGNHLDFTGLAWLENFVRGERCAILMVSHNRHLLDHCVDSILELESARLASYSGGWSDYRLEKLARAAGQGKEWQADRKRLERLEALVRRFAEIARSRPDPAWGKRLRARRSQLERERESAASRPMQDGRSMKVNFGAVASKADFALIVQGYEKAFGDRVVFRRAELDILAGERTALVGSNGSGKTTFLRDVVAAENRWNEGGPVRVGPSMRIGYCAQEQELFAAGRSVGEEFEALGAKRDEAWKLLRRYRFDRPILDAPTSILSGGERNRLQIARAVFLGANFLVLDEPTNHLDIESREALEEGLADFAGTILVVSHDRWFLAKIAERIVLLEGCAFVPYEGSFEEYWRDLGAKRRGIIASRGRAAAGGIGDRAAATRASRTPALELELRRSALEERITAAEKRKEALESASAAASVARDFARAGRAASEAAEANRALERLYAEWEALG